MSDNDRQSASPFSDLALVIVAWRGAKLVIDCLSSIDQDGIREGFPNVFVVDNDSGDGTAETVEMAIRDNGWEKWAQLLRAPTNGGFASGNNIAIRAALEQLPDLRYVELLNPDTLIRPGALRFLRDFLERNPKVGIAGGRSEDPDGTPQHCSFRFPTLLSEAASYLRLGIVDRALARWISRTGISQGPMPVDWVSGAHMMMRREVIDSIGLLDEGYFLYFEETDFTLRARKAGWSCWQVPESRVVHLVGQSSGVTQREGQPRRVPGYWFESRRRYFILNHGRFYAVICDGAVVLAYGLWRLRRWLQRKPELDPPYFLRDFLANSAIRYGAASLRPRVTDI